MLGAKRCERSVIKHLVKSAGDRGVAAANLLVAILLPARGRGWPYCGIVLASSLFLVDAAMADPSWESYVIALNRFDGSVTATLRIPSRVPEVGSEPREPQSAGCVVDVPGGTFLFQRLVDALVSGIFGLRQELPYSSLPAYQFKPDISIRFAQNRHEIMLFYFEERGDQLGVKGRLEDRSGGPIRPYRIRANPAFPNNLRELARFVSADQSC